MTTTQILRDARALIQKGWCRGAMKKDGRYCVYAAVRQAGAYYWRGGAWTCIEAVIGTTDIGQWNDKQKSKKPVLAAFDRAIQLAEREER